MKRTERTNVLTRERAPAESLLRVVASPDGQPVIDVKGRLPGRGAWVGMDRASLDKLRKDSRSLARALQIEVDGAALVAEIERVALQAVLDGLSIAQASGALVVGQDRVLRALHAQGLQVVGLASDLSERTRHMITEACAAHEVPVVELQADQATIGQRVGQGVLGVFGATSASGASHLRRWLRSIRKMG